MSPKPASASVIAGRDAARKRTHPQLEDIHTITSSWVPPGNSYGYGYTREVKMLTITLHYARCMPSEQLTGSAQQSNILTQTTNLPVLWFKRLPNGGWKYVVYGLY